MTKYEKTVIEDSAMRDCVLRILELLQNESYSDAKQILEAVHFFLRQNVYLDYSLAHDSINQLVNFHD